MKVADKILSSDSLIIRREFYSNKAFLNQVDDKKIINALEYFSRHGIQVKVTGFEEIRRDEVYQIDLKNIMSDGEFNLNSTFFIEKDEIINYLMPFMVITNEESRQVFEILHKHDKLLYCGTCPESELKYFVLDFVTSMNLFDQPGVVEFHNICKFFVDKLFKYGYLRLNDNVSIFGFEGQSGEVSPTLSQQDYYKIGTDVLAVIMGQPAN